MFFTSVSAVAFKSQCSVHLSASQVITASIDRKVLFDVTLWDNDLEYVASPDYRFIAKAAIGLYHVSLKLFMLSGVDSICEIHIRKNDVETKMNTNIGDTSGNNRLAVSGDIELEAGDFIEGWVRQSTGSNKNLSDTPNQTYMDIHRIA